MVLTRQPLESAYPLLLFLVGPYSRLCGPREGVDATLLDLLLTPFSISLFVVLQQLTRDEYRCTLHSSFAQSYKYTHVTRQKQPREPSIRDHSVSQTCTRIRITNRAATPPQPPPLLKPQYPSSITFLLLLTFTANNSPTEAITTATPSGMYSNTYPNLRARPTRTPRIPYSEPESPNGPPGSPKAVGEDELLSNGPPDPNGLPGRLSNTPSVENPLDVAVGWVVVVGIVIEAEANGLPGPYINTLPARTI